RDWSSDVCSSDLRPHLTRARSWHVTINLGARPPPVPAESLPELLPSVAPETIWQWPLSTLSRPRRRHEASDPQIPLPQKEQQTQRSQHHRREDGAGRGSPLAPACRQSRKLLLIDLNLGFDRGEIGAHLIRRPQR